MTLRDELRQNIFRHTASGSTKVAIECLTLIRVDVSKPVSGKVIHKPMVCVIAQGAKIITFGDSRLRYGPANYLLSGVDLPITGIVRNSDPTLPYLSLHLALDQQALSEMLTTLSMPEAAAKPSCGLSVGTLDDSLLDCFVRLTRLLDTPQYIPSIAPLIKREILCRLLLGEHGSLLQQSAVLWNASAPVTQVIHWIRSHYEKHFSVIDLAATAGMSPPSLHRHFRAVTAMSPLQYQKQTFRVVRVLRMTDEESVRFRQIAVIGVRRNLPSSDHPFCFGTPSRALPLMYALESLVSS